MGGNDSKENIRARQHAFRARRAALGLEEVRGIWLPKSLHKALKTFAKTLKPAGVHTGFKDGQR